jgi:hypothetical protein
MFVGHIGAGLIAKRVEPRLNLGTVFVAALFPDILLWCLVLIGVENVVVTTDFAITHYFTFDFPYSHSLASNIVFTAVAGLLAFALTGSVPGRLRIAIVFALAYLSHFLLDIVVHVPDIPFLGRDSPKLGLGLWSMMPVALALEFALAGVALFWYMEGPRTTIHGKPLVAGLVILLAAMTGAGPYLTTQVPESVWLALTSLVTLGVIVLIGFWADGKFSFCVAETEEE